MAILKKWTTLAVVSVALLSSCTTEENYPTETVYVNSFSKDYTVLEGNWKVDKDDSGEYFYCEFKEPNLTYDVYDYGVMQAFLLMNGENITPLPFNDYWWEGTDYYTGYHWTEQVTCEFSPGYVTFILKYSDHEIKTQPSYNRYDFRVRFMW